MDTHYMRLYYAPRDTLFFAEETLRFLQPGYPAPKTVSLGTGHQETRIGVSADAGKKTAKVFRQLLNRCRVYHFHDTSPMARVRQYCYIHDNRWLMPDAGNLAALLYRLQKEKISTKSSTFLNNFSPEDIVVAQRKGMESHLKRLDPVQLEAWLEEYSLGEVWEKNIIGGGPL